MIVYEINLKFSMKKSLLDLLHIDKLMNMKKHYLNYNSQVPN